MKKEYLGSRMDIFAAVMSLILCLVSFLMAILLPFYLTIGLFFAMVFLMGYATLIQMKGQWYAWGCIEDNGIHVSALGQRKYFLEYSKCAYIGLGCYGHTGTSGQVALVPTYIIFSDEQVSEIDKCNINRWKLSAGKLKIGFTQERYEYLLNVLPDHHAQTLREDHIRLYGEA